MKPIKTALLALPFLAAGCNRDSGTAKIRPLEAESVRVEDAFWSPRYEKWEHITVGDMLDKFEGNDPAHFACGVDAFENFDLVASGARDIGRHAGPPWYDGLVYETIRGISDLLAQRPDPALKARVDGYIARIEAAQKSDPDGFVGTNTQLTEDNHRWGANGGFLRMQHDVYNAGMLIEAGVHYYQATGDDRLLKVATRLADYMVRTMGPAPKKNIVPAHSGPEEALVKLYKLYRDRPGLRAQTGAQSAAGDYLRLAEFWIGNRGVHCGYPLWGTWGNDSAERWIHEELYTGEFGPEARPAWGDYAQDSIRVFDQPAIVGHAVRATLLATGIAAAAYENGNADYIATAKRWWDDMAGKKLFVTGGVGAVHFDEKFGHDYDLPTDAYLETCAAVGVGFFSQAMNRLTGDAKYMDEFERALYNNVLAGVAASGRQYTYQNPLNTDRSERWEWHPCPLLPADVPQDSLGDPRIHLRPGRQDGLCQPVHRQRCRHRARRHAGACPAADPIPRGRKGRPHAYARKGGTLHREGTYPGLGPRRGKPVRVVRIRKPGRAGALGERHPGRNPPRQRVRPPRPGLEPRRPHRAGTSRRAAPRPGT